MSDMQPKHPAPADEVLCDRAAQGDPAAEEERAGRYARLVRACARPLFLAGGDSEDLIQEGMVGLLTAIRTFSRKRDTAFRTYAEICIRSRLHSAIRAAQRDKHSPLNHSVSLPPLFDESNAHLFPREKSPEDVVIGREEFEEKLDALKGQLSGFESEILQLYLDGFSCREIAVRVGRSPKSVDNAVQRIRKKWARPS